MRRNNAVARSSHGRTIIQMEAAIAGAACRRGNGNGARGSRGGRGAATAPRGGRSRTLEFISEEEGLQQSQDDTYERDEEEKSNDKEVEQGNVVEAQDN
jgi:hypothetical protein